MQRVTYPERVLIVLNQDGSLKGAHQERIDQVVVDGEIVYTRQLAAEPLDSVALASVLPTQGALMAELAAAHASIEEKATALEQAETQLAALNAQIATLNAEIDALQNPPLDPVLSCTDLQFRLALNQLGLREAVEAYVATAAQDVRDWWERATMIHANNAMLINAAISLGKTQEDINAAISLGKMLA
ncbi:MAG: hypothetical protein FJX45_10380 [Alphaproteobacteria bacterium]|nr:hypothetical protein [Alphaproteobacteria bacterium]MBM3655148.1 hypothetical protein [Alphaproteobacteria bacterium]